MKQYQISKDGKVFAVVDVDYYSAKILRDMKHAGYKVKEIEVKEKK